ncbi:MAG TPA: hypothetical protein VFV66_26620 [Nonomuraea sp.]|nr:hypothetical protein [Nonomuraea sp.]
MTEHRAGPGRVTAASVAIAATLPYLTLKILWMGGSSIGVADAAFMRDPAMVALNAMTFGMDAVALVLALAFTMRWGRRLPAWLVLLPLWVGTGLLAVVAVAAPVVTVATGLRAFGGGPIAPWVYALVYGGFTVQAIGLVTAFAGYSRDRWPAVFTTELRHPFAAPSRPFQLLAARGSLLVAVVTGGIWLAQAVARVSVPDAFRGLLAIAGAVALVALVRRRGDGPFWRPLAVAWLGSGSLFGWGLFAVVVRSVGGPLADAAPGGPADLVEVFGLLTGLVMGMCGAVLLTERSGVGDVQPAEHPLEGVDRERDRQTADHGHR